MVSFATAKADAGTRRIAVITATGLVLLAVVTLPVARTPLAAVAPFLPMFASLAFALDAITAVLLFTHQRMTRHAPLAVLGAAYVYNAAIIVPHLLAFPGVFAPAGLLGGHPQSAVWLWSFWHGGFPLFILAYVAADRRTARAGPARMSPGALAAAAIGIALAAAGCAAIAATAGAPLLPPLVDHGNYLVGFRTGVMELVIGLNGAALAAVALLLRRKSLTQVWLVVALVASCSDVVLTLGAGARYTLGWYLSRVYSLGSASAIFGVFIAELTMLYGRMAELATIDGLTGIGNRRQFDERIASAVRDGIRRGRPVSVILFDVDHFKAYNDRYGHLAGDAALQAVALAAREALVRPADFLARYGGEEFAVIAPDTPADGGAVVAERIRTALAACRIAHADSSAGTFLSVSLGVATLDPAAPEDVAGLVARADAALYAAKAAGRNRVASAPVPAAGFVAV